MPKVNKRVVNVYWRQDAVPGKQWHVTVWDNNKRAQTSFRATFPVDVSKFKKEQLRELMAALTKALGPAEFWVKSYLPEHHSKGFETIEWREQWPWQRSGHSK